MSNSDPAFAKGQLVNVDDPVITVESVFCPLKGGGHNNSVPSPKYVQRNHSPARERLRIHLEEAKRATTSPVKAQLDAALDVWEDLPPTPLQECPVCGKVGLPERIQQHRCDNLNRKHS